MFAEHRPLARHLRRLSGQARTLPCSRGTATLILQLRKLKLSKAELWEFPGGPVVGGFVSLLREKARWRRDDPMGTGHGGNKDPCSLVTDRPCEGLQPLFPQEDFSLEVLCYFFFFF